jgi:hypothetical protein
MQAIFIAASVTGMLGWLGIPGPFVGSQPWVTTPTPHVVAAVAPSPIVAPIYTHDPAYRGCTFRNPCYER